MTNILKDNVALILILGFTFLVGIGVGAAITDMLWKWSQKK